MTRPFATDLPTRVDRGLLAGQAAVEAQVPVSPTTSGKCWTSTRADARASRISAEPDRDRRDPGSAPGWFRQTATQIRGRLRTPRLTHPEADVEVRAARLGSRTAVATAPPPRRADPDASAPTSCCAGWPCACSASPRPPPATPGPGYGPPATPHPHPLEGPAGTFRLHTELTPTQRAILATLDLTPPKKSIEVGLPTPT